MDYPNLMYSAPFEGLDFILEIRRLNAKDEQPEPEEPYTGLVEIHYTSDEQ